MLRLRCYWYYLLVRFLSETIDLSKKFKKKNKIVVLGGVHPSVLPQQSLADSGADCVIVGEGEITFDLLLQQLAKNEKPEIVFHYAAQIDVRKSVENPIEDAKINIQGTLNI